MILICLSLMMIFTARASKTDDTSVLKIDSVRIVGNMMDMMTQHLYIYCYNMSNEDFSGMVYLVDDQGNGQFEWAGGTLLDVKARESIADVSRIQLKEGDHNLRLAADKNGKTLLSKNLSISIGPLRPIDFSVKYYPEMMSNVDGENILSGHRLQGHLEMTNNDVVPYYGIALQMSHAQGVMFHLKEEDTEKHVAFNKWMFDEIEIGQTVRYDFTIDCDFEEGKRYSMILTYAQPHDIVTLADSLTFTFHAGTNTYWTKDGEVKPVPVDGNQRLVVPEEAVAVDLRGQYYMNTVYAIDISQANPNCLYYLDFLDNVPQGLNEGCNVVRDREAAIIRFTDNHDFYCPKSFKAKFVSYTLTPNSHEGAYAETLVLPFHAQNATLDAINQNYYGLLKVFEYSGYDNVADTLDIREIDISQMEAYKPYIVAVGEHTPVTFLAENMTVPVTTQAVIQTTGLDFVGGTVFQAPGEMPPYRYEPSMGVFAVQNTNDMLPPFRAWFKQRYYEYEEENNPGGEATSMVYNYLRMNTGFDIGGLSQRVATPIETASSYAIYSLCGKKVNGRLAKGIYIVGGKKLVVK